MSLTRNDPWSMMNRLQGEIQRLYPYRAGAVDGSDSSSIATSHWAPPVDIVEESERYLIVADVPGVAPESIEITMEAGVLTLKGERKDVLAENRDGARRVERASGTFYRRFSLPDGIDAEHVTAKGHLGVLEVSIPKVEKVKQRRITVQ